MTAPAWLALLYAAHGQGYWHTALAETGSIEALLAANDRQLAALGAAAESLARLRNPDPAALQAWQSWLELPGHDLVTWGSPRYPELLSRIDNPPLALWVTGRRPELLNAPQLAIVGSRNATRGGCETAEQFAFYLSERGLTVTSGLAAGIDTASHTGALRGTGSTLAVFGCGIDIVFPRNNRSLAREIAAAGLLVSEYPPGTPPLAHQFPERNRIIAGLTVGTLVVEASRRSGSLITARRAGDFGREVFAIPGSIHNPLSRGCHALIRQGAKLVEEGGDVLVELAPLLQLRSPPENPSPEPEAASLLDDPAYENLLNSLEFHPMALADLASRGGLTTAELSSMLLVLELEGFVEALPGGRYCRLHKRSR